MTVKTTGAEWKRFYTDEDIWPSGAWHDDEEIAVNGEIVEDLEKINDGDVVRITGGTLFLSENDECGLSLERYFKRWRKDQNTRLFNVECEKDKFDAVRRAVVSAGGKVIGG